MENTTTIQNNSEDIVTLAVQKIKKEFLDFTGGNKEKAVSSYVSNTLQGFCEEDERFAEVVYKMKRTLSDCCADIMSGCGNAISDIDVYRSAVQFYFPNSEIVFKMEIHVTGEPPSEEELAREAEKKQSRKQPNKKSKEDDIDDGEDSEEEEVVPVKTVKPAVEKPKPIQEPTPKVPKENNKKKATDSTIQLTLF